MLRRLFLVFLPSLTVSVSFANEASWNCEQDKESKEWVCIGEKKQTAQANKATPPVKRESVRAAQPALTHAVEKTPVDTTQPLQVTAPSKPISAKPIQPVIAKPVTPAPVETRQTARPLPVQASTPVTAKSVESLQTAKPASARGNQPVASKSTENIQPALSAPAKSAVDSGNEAKHTGWSCGASKADGSWNCQLVGAETKGKSEAAMASEPTGNAGMVKTGEPMIRLLTPAFDHQQEQIFGTLVSQLKYDPWENCSVGTGTNRNYVPEADKRETSPMDVESNYAEVFDSEVGSYSGNVKMTRADQQSSSNTANYDSVSEVLDLHGNVYYREDELALSSDSATLNLASNQAKMRKVQFIAPTTPLRGRAQVVYRDSKTFSRYKDVAYTSCRPGNQDWVVHASELKMNKISGKGSAKNPWVEFKGVPVFYSPYLSFPIDNRRASGFLSPSFGSTKTSGFNIKTPFYWNIAPNYDATLIPHELTKRGPLLAGRFRYLTEQSNGKVAMEIMPHDQILNKARYLGSFKNVSQLTDHISSNLDLNYVSDKTYFANLGNALSFSNFNYLRSYADINYATQGVSFNTQVQNYQSINASIDDAALPYKKLPQMNLNLDHAFQFMPLYTAMENEYVYFQHSAVDFLFKNKPILDLSGQPINIKPSGSRINTKPSVSLPLQTSSAFFTPKISLQHTQYFLNSGQPTLDNSGNPALDSSRKFSVGTSGTSISRTLPILSADSGLFLERNFNFAQNSYLHTLEPRLFYLYVPFTNQEDIPVFDSALYDFQFNSLFRENSFSGTDRIQDANQISTAITSRLVDEKDGLERLKLSVGEIFYFRDRLVSTPGVPVQQGSFSNVVAELNSQLTKNLALTTGLQWNPQLNDIQRGNAALHFSTESNEILNAGYLYRKNPLIPNRTNDVIQTDMSFRLPIYNKWYAVGRWQYSLLYNITQDGMFGLEKENCCWRFRIIGRHYMNNINSNNSIISSVANLAPTGTAQNGVFFEIELKGLTGIGTNLDNFFAQTIYGYRKSQNEW
ncbi:MAG: LPS assembly protein LptD [Methylococcales bacterium]|nr:LPS assembly protein LptD [Methylococcales bacterium]MDD5630598.1 LPS assembly protein LptD [Methylococcales bacterium]